MHNVVERVCSSVRGLDADSSEESDAESEQDKASDEGSQSDGASIGDNDADGTHENCPTLQLATKLKI